MTAKKQNKIAHIDRKNNPPGAYPVLMALLALAPMTRHALAEAMGISYDTTSSQVASLQAQGLVTPAGFERTPGRRTWRILFRATGGQA